jgi:AcrR family transcriptional regulator
MATDSSKIGQMRRKPQQTRSQERVDRILEVAEQLFIEIGYEQTTTRAIATRAEVPVGSLYQFFPDKEAILKALGDRYLKLQYQLFVEIHAQESDSPLEIYANRVIDALDRFATENPGYRAILGQLLDLTTWSTATTLDEYDRLILQELVSFIMKRNPVLDKTKCEFIALIVLKTTGELLWFALSDNQAFREKIVAETKTLIMTYLKAYEI